MSAGNEGGASLGVRFTGMSSQEDAPTSKEYIGPRCTRALHGHHVKSVTRRDQYTHVTLPLSGAKGGTVLPARKPGQHSSCSPGFKPYGRSHSFQRSPLKVSSALPTPTLPPARILTRHFYHLYSELHFSISSGLRGIPHFFPHVVPIIRRPPPWPPQQQTSSVSPQQLLLHPRR